MIRVPRYAPNVSKALEVILWIAQHRPGLDIYHIVKAVFFADKMHVSQYGRPICGDSYSAAPWGPLAQVTYNLLRHDPIELIALESNGDLPFRVTDRYEVYGDREPNLRLLSETDVEALRYGVDHVKDKTFGALYLETHDDPAYLKAIGGQMDYRDFIPDNDEAKDAKDKVIEESAQYAIF